jgi:hypothetical protein
MAAVTRPQKITLADMRAAGVRGLTVPTIIAAIGQRSAATDGRMTCACPIWSRGLPPRLAAGAALRCGRISIGKEEVRRPGAH